MKTSTAVKIKTTGWRIVLRWELYKKLGIASEEYFRRRTKISHPLLNRETKYKAQSWSKRFFRFSKTCRAMMTSLKIPFPCKAKAKSSKKRRKTLI